MDGQYTFDYLRTQLVGQDTVFKTPFGKRLIFYADYTASGRGLKFIEEKIQNIQRSYANTHTEDDYSGKYLTNLLHQAESRIKEIVHAGADGKIAAVGSGATGALKHLQEIIGVYIPPVTKDRIYSAIREMSCDSCTILRQIEDAMPVIFIGPYEHHTNELMWREAFAKVEVIPLDGRGMLDLEILEMKLRQYENEKRVKIGSFSAGSNITGVKTKVYEVARICHRYNAYVFFDFAAVAPYVKIDMNKDPESSFDAVFFSPHKFIGGPGSTGILVFNSRLYRNDLPPTTAGGGTVDFVGFKEQDYAKDIETREKAGTPPILQTIKAALVMDLQEKIGIKKIEEKEAEYTRYFLQRIERIPGISLIGDISAEDRVAIVSFNIRHQDRILHPKFVTRLMNDLFGIQSRAGCSCAGPYGHTLLKIDEKTSDRHRQLIRQGVCGIKPGWIRINLHYLFSKEDIEFLLDAIEFVAHYGHRFLRLYEFSITSSEWQYLGWHDQGVKLDIDSDFQTETASLDHVRELRQEYFQKARSISDQLQMEQTGQISFAEDQGEIETLKYFYYINRQKGEGEEPLGDFS